MRTICAILITTGLLACGGGSDGEGSASDNSTVTFEDAVRVDCHCTCADYDSDRIAAEGCADRAACEAGCIAAISPGTEFCGEDTIVTPDCLRRSGCAAVIATNECEAILGAPGDVCYGFFGHDDPNAALCGEGEAEPEAESESEAESEGECVADGAPCDFCYAPADCDPSFDGDGMGCDCGCEFTDSDCG